MSKIGKFVSADENDVIVNEMLKGNEVIEEALAKWKEDTHNIDYKWIDESGKSKYQEV